MLFRKGFFHGHSPWQVGPFLFKKEGSTPGFPGFYELRRYSVRFGSCRFLRRSCISSCGIFTLRCVFFTLREFPPCAVCFSPCGIFTLREFSPWNFHPALCIFHPLGIFTLRCVFFILWEFSPCAVYFSSFGNFHPALCIFHPVLCIFHAVLCIFHPVEFSPCAVYFSYRLRPGFIPTQPSQPQERRQKQKKRKKTFKTHVNGSKNGRQK